MAQIFASLDDINANLPSVDQVGQEAVATATDENTTLLQVSVARIIRGYLARVVDNETLFSWETPETTPEIVTEIAAKLIASQLYFNETAKTNIEISPDSFAQKLYDQAMALLNGIVTGDILIDGEIPTTPVNELNTADGWPIDSTDRAFTVGMEL